MRYFSRQAFEAWLSRADENCENHKDIELMKKELRVSYDPWDAYVNDTLKKLSEGKCISRKFDTNCHFDTRLVGLGNDSTDFSQLTFLHYQRQIDLENISIRQLQIYGSNKPVTLKNLRVDKLTFGSVDGVTKMENVWIGDLVFSAGNRFQSFYCSGGGILNIAVDTPDGNNPFNGSIHFADNIYFPRKIGFRLEGPQPYRNMRAHMLKLENTPMVSRFFTLEQATERRLDPKWSLNRFISWIYELLSDYSASTPRPIMALAILFLISSTITYISDGAAVGDPIDLVGWQKNLCGDSQTASALRAVVLAGNAILNPLSVLGVKGLLVPKYSWLAFWNWLSSAFAALFIALFFLSVRRRFKMT